MTTNSVVLDTSIIIEFARNGANEEMQLFLNKKSHNLYVSVITSVELYSGKSYWERPRARELVDLMLSKFETVAITSDIAKKAGEIHSIHGGQIADCIIAATAICTQSTLVTLNTKHFASINGLLLQKEL